MQAVPAGLPAQEAIADGEANPGQFYCALKKMPERVYDPGVTGDRLELIHVLSNKWNSGTTLRYHFFDRDTDGENVMFSDGTTEWRTWVGDEDQKGIVRKGFEAWREIGLGIEFLEVPEREEAEVRIGFMRGDGAWSWLGRDILEHSSPNERTMNFGWDLTRPGELDTAIHEIGHTLGFPHEHQNPKAGIEWNEEAVYEALAQPPNNWDRDKIFWNIIRKLPDSEVEGTIWDPNSVMHYPFKKGLIKKPEKYLKDDLLPAGGLSEKDKAWAKMLYPNLAGKFPVLKPGVSIPLQISAGEQRHFSVQPDETRYYHFQTFGTSDSVMVLFEKNNQQFRYRSGDDDNGLDTNAHIYIKLVKDHRYELRLRLYYSERPGETAIMMW